METQVPFFYLYHFLECFVKRIESVCILLSVIAMSCNAVDYE